MANNKSVVRYKMVIFGDTKVGKTSLLERYVNDRFKSSYISTLGYNVYEKRIPYKDSEISLMIYDIGGQEKFREVRKKYAEGANTAFIVYDITNDESFENIKNWKNDLQEFSGDIPFVLIGNKIDLENQRKVSKEQGIQLSKKINALDFIETSAKTGSDVQKAFEQLAIKTYDSYIS